MSKFTREYARKAGLTVEDAKHHLAVSVNKTDVKRGDSKNPEGCALARAILAERPEAKRVFIFRTTAVVETARRLVRYSMPESVQREVEAFDRFGVMEPGVYKLNAPPPTRRKEAAKAYDAARPKKKPRPSGAPKKKMRLEGKIRCGLKEVAP